ncbi:Peroxisomal membrane protein PMP27 [Elasticomyces elasticus]|nr:Peroxisomal membrane protein PMP27 [Elasticomyces elasticus]
MVADAVIYHPTVSHYLKFVATTVGRDKTLRTVQYFSRFLAWYLYRTNHPQTTIALFDGIKKNFGSVRKAMRLGKFVEHFKAAAVAADAKGMDPILRCCAIGRQLGYAVYMSLDTLTYLDATGIRPSVSAKRLQREAYKAWMTGLLFNVMGGVYTLYMMTEKSRSMAKDDGEKAVTAKKFERENNQAKIQLTSDICDLAIPLSALGYADLDDGIVGLAGTVSSLLGLYTQWTKTA